MESELTIRLKTHVGKIARDRDPYFATEGRFYVRQYLRQQLEQWGRVQTHEFVSLGQTHQNLIVDLPGNRGYRPPILVGAHYDAAPNSPGADDNASGVAVLLELARLFAAQPANYPLRLVAFDFEETQTQNAGSYFYAQQLQGEPLRLMLSLEMLGYYDPTPGSQQYPLASMQAIYPQAGDFIALIGTPSTLVEMIHLAWHLGTAGVPGWWLPVPNRGLILPETRRSDHAAFWDLGYRAMMVTDTAYLRNPHYHKPSDRPETLNFERMTQVCLGLATGLRCL